MDILKKEKKIKLPKKNRNNNRLFISSIFLFIPFTIIVLFFLKNIKCERFAMCPRDPVRVEGRLLFKNNQEISCTGDIVLSLRNIINEGKPAKNQKDKGLAVLTFIYSNGREITFEITDTGLVRKDGIFMPRVVQTDLVQIKRLLESI